ncbi:MAG: TonB-dependent receptor [Nibricoccus sp.]
MKPTQPNTMQNIHRSFFRWMTTGVVALVLSLTSAVYAQTTGTISGQVVDSSTGKYLEGAEVNVNDLRTTTERDGRFTVRNVPAGSQKVIVNYPGLETTESAVEVAAGQTVDVAVKMASSEVITLGEFKVEGAKEGMSQAVALQKVAIQAKLVTAGDQFGAISEGNVGEYLKYLPGVGVDYNVNDARGVSLRGLRTSFTIIAVDGTPMASASSGAANRRFELEQVNSTNVETTEVYKMLLPDAPADATGGYINMVTKSAFDRQDIQRIEYDVSLLVPSSRLNDALSSQAGTWGGSEHHVVRPNMDMNFARRVSDKFGFNLSYKLSERYDDSPRTEYTWLTTAAAASGTAATNPLTLADPTLSVYNQNNEQKLTHRESFGAKLDYFITDSTKLTFSGQWNWYDLTFSQRAMTYTFGTNSVVNLPGIENNQAAGSGRSIANNVNQRRKYGTTTHLNTTLRHEFNDHSSAWLTGYWSQADSKYRDTTGDFLAQVSANYNGNPGFVVSNVASSQKNPGVAVNGATEAQLRSLANYTIQNGASTRSRPLTGLDTKSGVRGDYKYELDLAVPLTLQSGFAYDVVSRGINEFEFRAPTSVTGSASAIASDYIFDYGYNYGVGQVVDVYKAFSLFGATVMDTRPNTWNVTHFQEDNKAGYFRADAVFLKNLTLAGGVRWEQHNLEANRFSVVTAGSRPNTVKLDYSKLYPSLMAKYQPTRQWIFRTGVSKTVGHPDYAEVLPTVTYIEGSTTGINITVPADGLKPYYVTNYDVSGEYYFSKSGLVSASIFRKDVEGFISAVGITDPAQRRALIRKHINPNFSDTDPLPTGTFQEYQNGKNSTVEGLELMYNQNLSFLPAPFNGLNLQVNWSKMDVDADADVDPVTGLPNGGTSTQYAQETAANLQTFNFAIGYRQKKFSTQVSANWTDDKLIATSISNNTLNSYQAPDWKVNITAKYELNRHYIVYINVSNLFSQRTEYYRGSALGTQDTTLPFRKFEFGYPHIALGVKGSF